jgi:choline transport protein
LSMVWYFIRGKKEYHGPLIDDEVAAIMQGARRESVVSVEVRA